MSQSTVHERTIQGVRYTMRPLGWEDGLSLSEGVARVVGPALGSLFDNARDEEEDGDGEPRPALGAALTTFFDRMPRGELVRVAKVLLKVSEVEGEEGRMVKLSVTGVADLHFRGRMRALHEFVRWGLEVQCAGFFEPLTEQLAGALARFGGGSTSTGSHLPSTPSESSDEPSSGE